MAGVAVVVVADKQQRVIFQHGHGKVKQLADIDAFGDGLSDLTLCHHAGTAQVRCDHHKISVAGREFFQGEGSFPVVF